jgi:murein DD-endopeptidase MepM/ murein hydrolase activator NlpD
VPLRLTRRHRLPVVRACLAAAIAFVLVPAGLGRVVPATPDEVVPGGLAAAAGDALPSAGALLAPAISGAPAPTVGRGASPLVRTGERPTAPDLARLTGYGWPLAKGRLTAPFGRFPGATFLDDGHAVHDGIDVASFCGDRVVAAHDGVVIAAGRHFDDEIGWLGDLGPYYARLDEKDLWRTLPIALIVDDGNGYRSVYAHFERVVVHVGDRIRGGHLVGYEGRTGHATGCHVHYGLVSPLETARFSVRTDVAKRLRTPAFEIARVDPLAVLPGASEALRTRHFGASVRPSGGSAAR